METGAGGDKTKNEQNIHSIYCKTLFSLNWQKAISSPLKACSDVLLTSVHTQEEFPQHGAAVGGDKPGLRLTEDGG